MLFWDFNSTWVLLGHELGLGLGPGLDNCAFYRHFGQLCKIKRWRRGLFPEQTRKFLVVIFSTTPSFFKAELLLV